MFFLILIFLKNSEPTFASTLSGRDAITVKNQNYQLK